MDLLLKDRVVLVTAASQGLGYHTALQFSQEGALVAICSRDEGRINAARDGIRAETGNPVLAIIADLTKPDDIIMLIDRVIEEYGGLDILVTNSGGPPGTTFEETTDAMWQKAVDLLLMSAVRLIRAALPHLRQSTSPAVLTITSLAVKQPIENLLLSNSVRLSVIGLTKSLALELGREGIRFNSILPAWVETERIHDLMEMRAERNNTSVDDELEKQSKASVIGRMAAPQEFSSAAVFLCSPVSSYLTGVMLSVDGGIFRGLF